MIFARSRRSPVLLAACGLSVAAAFGVASLLALIVGAAVFAALVLAAGCGVGLVLATWGGIRLRTWPGCRVGLFRDRLVVIEGRVEQHAIWDRVETASLVVPFDWSGPGWPKIQISDELTVTLLRGRPVIFRPAIFGLDPAGCRDLVLGLRDDRELRSRLPEFDSSLDLSERPVVSGELITPRL